MTALGRKCGGGGRQSVDAHGSGRGSPPVRTLASRNIITGLVYGGAVRVARVSELILIIVWNGHILGKGQTS
jgi:hypothetical protein